MSNSPVLDITLMAENVLAKEIIFNEAVLKMEALVVGVVQNIQNAPPTGTISDGVCYIVGTAPSGAWAGKARHIAMRYNGWQFIAPSTRMRMFNVSASAYYRYSGSAWNAEAAGTASELSDLTDVALGTPLNNYVLGYSTVDNKWHAIPAPSVINSINDLNDVVTSGGDAPATGETLIWDGTNWKPGPLPEEGVSSLLGLSDVDPAGLADGKLLMWETTPTPRVVFVDPADLVTVTQLSDLPDVTVAGRSIGDALVWNGATWGPSSDLIEFKFENMLNGPGSMIGAAGKFLVVDELELGLAYKSISEILAEGVDVKLQDLADVPGTIGSAGQVLRVNSAGTGFEYFTPSSGLTVQQGTDTPLTTAAKRLSFVGAVVTEPATDEIIVTIPEAATQIEWQDGGDVLEDVSAINFTGPGVTVTNDAGVVEVNVTGTDKFTDLTDVEIVAPVDGDVVYWDATTSRFEAKPVSTLVANIDGVVLPNTYELGPMAPPVPEMFPDRYQSTGVVMSSVPQRGMLVIPGTLGATPYHQAVTRTLTAFEAPWTVTCRVSPSSFSMDEHAAGLMIERATNGAMVFIGISNDQYDALPDRLVFGHANSSHVETLVFNKKVRANWLRLEFDGNTIYARASQNGLLWSTVGTLDAATVLGGIPTKVGLFQRLGATPSGDTGALYTYYEDPDFPASARTTMGFALPTMSILGDVDLLTTPQADGQVLVWDEAEGKWVPGDGASVTPDLSDLGDVDFTTPPTNGQVIVWDSTSGKWKPGDAAGGGGGELATLTDVDFTTPPTEGQTLVYDETLEKWVPADPSGGSTLASLTDVDFTGLAAGDLMKWDGTDWKPFKEAHEVGLSLISAPTASEKLLRYKFASAVNWPVNLVGSQLDAGVAATASTTFTLRKNGTSVGTIAFAASGTTGTATVASAVSWAVGDVLLVEAPAVPDATLAQISFTIKGTRA